MQVISQNGELAKTISTYKKHGKTIGFVPTMGALHEGHLSLVEMANSLCDVVVISIFVNPAQFDRPEDLKKYPRSLEKDLALLEEHFPKTLVFTPSVEEIYGKSPIVKHFEFGSLETEMEGKYRTGHFDGVGTVLQLLFDIVKPDKAFFGEKDFQQLQIVRKLVKITVQPLQIIGCPISRETNGLARSSRNERLTPAQRKEAAFIYETLQKVKSFFGTKSVSFIDKWVWGQFNENQELKLEYFQIADVETLKRADQKEEGRIYRAFIAVYAGEVRLIDNISLN